MREFIILAKLNIETDWKYFHSRYQSLSLMIQELFNKLLLLMAKLMKTLRTKSRRFQRQSAQPDTNVGCWILWTGI